MYQPHLSLEERHPVFEIRVSRINEMPPQGKLDAPQVVADFFVCGNDLSSPCFRQRCSGYALERPIDHHQCIQRGFLRLGRQVLGHGHYEGEQLLLSPPEPQHVFLCLGGLECTHFEPARFDCFLGDHRLIVSQRSQGLGAAPLE